jgi:vanillate O-demethylase ferredoxin subunit
MSSLSIEVVVMQAIALTQDVTQFRLRRLDGASLPAFSAGAHVLISVVPGISRAYSLCGDPAETGHYDIAVKREDHGRGGSRALHALAHSGSRLAISEPRNQFALEPDAPHHLLIGGGIGITPLIAMAYQLHRKNAAFSFASFSRSLAHLPFADLLEQGPWKQRVAFHFDNSVHLSLEEMVAALPPGTHVYCCGPTGFMANARQACAAIPDTQWHEERFSAASVKLGSLQSERAELFLAQSNQRIGVTPGQTLLDALREGGVAVDSACEQGVCGSCVVAYSDGQPIHGDECLSDDERAQYVAVCRAGCGSSTLTLQL